jgi:hypothetical protein
VKCGAANAPPTAPDHALQKAVHEQLVRLPHQGTVSSAIAGELELECCEPRVCSFEWTNFNPSYWNASEHVRLNNNCYNYASNKRTDTFAQPGRATGHMYSDLTCQAVTAGALSDGLRPRGECVPDCERPRWYIALVIAPGPGFRDFHWYREAAEGFWGHKPGGTEARYTDNCGRVIFDPREAARGPYTQFCGFFYGPRDQRIN